MVSTPNNFTANIKISRGPEPQTHLNTNWISLHNQVYDQSCANCHTTDNPGGEDNTSFCANSACHGSVWEYAGFDAPRLREILLSQLPPTPTPAPAPENAPLNFIDTIGPLLAARCGACHGPNGLQGLDLTSYAAAIQGEQSGPAITAGIAEASLLVQKQRGEQPHFGQLNPDELQMVIAWINAGAIEK